MCRTGPLVTFYDFSNVACVFVGTRKRERVEGLHENAVEALKIN